MAINLNPRSLFKSVQICDGLLGPRTSGSAHAMTFSVRLLNAPALLWHWDRATQSHDFIYTLTRRTSIALDLHRTIFKPDVALSGLYQHTAQSLTPNRN